MRILLSSVGRRGYLVRFFRAALTPHDEIWGGDCSPYTSAFNDCDNSVLLPEVSDPDYINHLIDLSKRCGIDMIIPLIDPELEVLAPARDRLAEEGVLAVVSPPKTIAIGFDKYLTYQFGKENDIPVPRTVLTIVEAENLLSDGTLKWPLVVKPRKGSASMDITYCRNMLELQAAFESCPLPMIQEYLLGREYGYDLFSDRDYRPISVFCKLKIAMRAGETDKAVNIDDPELIGLGVKIAEALELFGPLDADVIVDDNGPRLLELNPRFGGGYPCSHLCGADFPRKLIDIYHNKPLTPDIDSARPTGVHMFKQDEIICRTQELVKATHTYSDMAVTKPLSLLFTSVGRRVSLLQEFRRAANDLGLHVKIHAADCNPLAPALHVAEDVVIIPPIDLKHHLRVLLDFCREHGVDALVPLIDPELESLANASEAFARIGTKVIISSPEVIRVAIDKFATAEFLVGNGFSTARILTEEDLASPTFPLFIKPRDGSSSLGAHKIETAKDLAYFCSIIPNPIVQEFVKGNEYTVDVFADFDGKPLCAVPRIRCEVRAGEVSKGQAIAHTRMMQENCRLVEALAGCVGMITIQCFLSPDDTIVFTEINPRFGGGVPLSIRAGADSPRWLLELLTGRKPSARIDDWTAGLLMLRYDKGVFVLPQDLPKA